MIDVQFKRIQKLISLHKDNLLRETNAKYSELQHNLMKSGELIEEILPNLLKCLRENKDLDNTLVNQFTIWDSKMDENVQEI